MTSITLIPELEKAFKDLGFSAFTEIQEKTIPLVQQGQDVIGQSYTGSGKTIAFGFPTLEKVKRGNGLQLLIIVPTRELCLQVTNEFYKFSKYKPVNIVDVYGGVSINPQIDRLRRADVVVSTPGRLLDHLTRGTLNPSKIKMLVLDEADKMFEMGFIDDVKEIISQLPRERQTLLFSATISQDVLTLVHRYMHNPVKIKLQLYVDKSQLQQQYYEVEGRDKFSLLAHLLKQETAGLCIIFCATRRMVDVLGRNLGKQRLKAQALHGGLSQNRRQQVIEDFHAHKLDVLIASDVAARGLDIKDVNLIVNYDIPKNSKDYVHRIGRTARAGSSGKVISLLSPMDHDNFRRVLEDRSLDIRLVPLPTFERIVLQRSEPQRREPQQRGRFQGGRGRRW